MAKLRETVCKYYQSAGQCQKGREASQWKYCQTCSKYEPRAKVRHLNQKKRKLETINQKEQKESMR